MTNNTKYTDLTQSKRLKEIGFEAKADGYYTTDENGVQLYYSLTEPNFMDIETFAISSVTGNVTIKELSHWIKSYRLDTLLLRIKPIVWDSIQYYAWALDKKHIEFIRMSVANRFDLEEARRLYIKIVKQQGPQAIAAAVDLICLLKELEVQGTRSQRNR